MTQAVIFDLDGTLVDSAPDIHAAANSVLVDLNCEAISYQELQSFVGNGIPKLVERLMRARKIEYSPNLHQEITGEFVAAYAAKPCDKTVLYDGVYSLLEKLRVNEIALGVCTNKNLSFTVQILECLKIDAFFDSVIGGDSFPVRKPDPLPLVECMSQLKSQNIVYVGDSEVDAATALAAGEPFALYTEGYRRSTVSEIEYKFAFSHFDELGTFIEQEMSGCLDR